MIQIAISAKGEVVAGAFFYKLPVETRLDFNSVPKGFLTLAEGQAIGKDLAEKKTAGVVREYTWKVVG